VQLELKLREFSKEDAETVATLVGDRDLSRWTSSIPHPYTLQDACDWITRLTADRERQSFAVELKGELVSCMAFWPHDDHSVEVGYWVGKPYWGRGIGSRALQALLASAVFPADKAVVAKVMTGNTGSQKVLLNNGFSFVRDCAINKNGKNVKAKFFVKDNSIC
jgi:ribosomal-protein-alanine N-acetyltransferase